MRAKDFISQRMVSDIMKDMVPSSSFVEVQELCYIPAHNGKSLDQHILAEVVNGNSFSEFHKGAIVIVPKLAIIPIDKRGRNGFIKSTHIKGFTKRTDWPITDENRNGSEDILDRMLDRYDDP